MHRKRISRMLAAAVLAAALGASATGPAYLGGSTCAWASSLKSSRNTAAEPKERGEKTEADAGGGLMQGNTAAEAGTPSGKKTGTEPAGSPEPEAGIYFTVPEEWQEDRAAVRIEVKGLPESGMPQLESVQARAGQDQEWADVTEQMAIEITENCAIHARATDMDGKTYEGSCFATCFDHEPPTVGAAIDGGLLHIAVDDDISGAAAAYVNGYRFTGLEDGKLDIRLQKFDAGYGQFRIQAEDGAGNLSEARFVQNPYFQDADAKSGGSGTDLSSLLPPSAMPTAPAEATATVTDHVLTDGSGNVTETAASRAYSPGRADPATADGTGPAPAAFGADDAQTDGTGGTTAEGTDAFSTGQGREFYTIQTESGKVFYLVVGRDGTQEDVHFLTDITENDLLNATQDNSATLPQNSAVPESGNGAAAGTAQEDGGLFRLPDPDTETGGAVTETGDGEGLDGLAEKRRNPAGAYAIFGALAALALGAAYHFKKKAADRDGDFLEDEDEDEEDVYDSEDEETESAGDGFFERDSLMEMAGGAPDGEMEMAGEAPDGEMDLTDEEQAWKG